MYFNKKIRTIGHADVKGLKETIPLVSESVWQTDRRMKHNSNFKDAPSLWMRMLPFTEDGIFHSFDTLELCNSLDFRIEYLKLHNTLEGQFDGKIVRSSIIRLLPGNSVGRHVDGVHPVFRYCYRIILPIQSNEKCTFQYDEDTFTLDEGTIYDTNPYYPHLTFNGGSTVRYQAVIDLLPNCIPDSFIKTKNYKWSKETFSEVTKTVPTSVTNSSLLHWEDILEEEKKFFEENVNYFPKVIEI